MTVGKLIDNQEDLFNDRCETGDFGFDGTPGTEKSILIVMPPHNRLAGIPIHRDRAVADRSPSPVWWWDGNREAPTLEPSILAVDTGWHGYMRAGVLVEV